ncbi:hypothetical protein SAMN04488128_1021540 [Chitinophaga eiseniae]|uniref:Uncharacterized protein n=1 Tax=Chitinophaga eiseniae TaxID=634771 RepID=A0A1T4RW09_9BACT|nr:hypothetical protein SAMN04488128_1021540 [Chitinophaga eiseniae]
MDPGFRYMIQIFYTTCNNETPGTRPNPACRRGLLIPYLI